MSAPCLPPGLALLVLLLAFCAACAGAERLCRRDARCYHRPCSEPFDILRPQCWRRCGTQSRAKALSAFGNLTAHMQGQDEALRDIRIKLQEKLTFPEKPLALHLAGDNGVGKTHISKLISNALFMRKGDRSERSGEGLLLLDTSVYGHVDAANASATAAARAALVATVLGHLRDCPTAVVVVDELENLHPQIASALAPLLKGLVVGGVGTNRALFVLTSDFGRQGAMTGKSREEIRRHVYQFTAQLYTDQSLAHHLEVIPFLTPRLAEFELIANTLFRELVCEHAAIRCLQYDTLAVSAVARRAWDGVRARNAREVESKFVDLVRGDLVQELEGADIADVFITGDPPRVLVRSFHDET